MFETIIAIALLVFIPMFFHWWITSAYYNQSKTFFGNDDIIEDSSIDNVGSEESITKK